MDSNYKSYIETEIATRLFYLQDKFNTYFACEVNNSLCNKVLELKYVSNLTKSTDYLPNRFAAYKLLFDYEIEDSGYNFARKSTTSTRHSISSACSLSVKIDYSELSIRLTCILEIEKSFDQIKIFDVPGYDKMNDIYSSTLNSILDNLKKIENYIRW